MPPKEKDAAASISAINPGRTYKRGQTAGRTDGRVNKRAWDEGGAIAVAPPLSHPMPSAAAAAANEVGNVQRKQKRNEENAAE